jgi:peroxiredoxin
MKGDSLVIGAVMPSFVGLRAVDGRSYSSSDFQHHGILVIVFSCNHCPYVQAYEQRMIEFQQANGPNGVQLVAINSNDTRNYPDDDFAGMVIRAQERGFTFPYLRDDDQSVAGAYGATHTPEFFVFDRKRKLRYHGKMDDNYKDPAAVKRRYLQEAVDAVLAGKPVAEPETHSIGCTIKWKM